MPTPTADLTDADAIDALAGLLGITLRTDDVGGPNVVDADGQTLMQRAIKWGSGRVYFFAQGKYSNLVDLQYPHDAATLYGVFWMAMRRYNAVPATVAMEKEDYDDMLTLVLKGQAVIPGGSRVRRPAVVTNYSTDLRRFNNQERVNRPESTGIAGGYVRKTDETAPSE